VLEKCGARISILSPSGTQLLAGVEFLKAGGPARALHAGWKVALNLLEYASGIASRTSRIVQKAKTVNPSVKDPAFFSVVSDLGRAWHRYRSQLWRI